MSFSQNVKLEIVNKEYDEKHLKDLINGFLSCSSKNRDGNFFLTIKKPLILEKIISFLSKSNIDFTLINQKIIFQNINFNEVIISQSSFLSGVFLVGGSISSTESTFYHLELQFFSFENAIFVKNFFNKYFSFTILNRKNKWILYLKKSEIISDFLKAIETFKSLMIFEDSRIKRDFRNQLNRFSNLDYYNQIKLVNKSDIFKRQLKFIFDNNLEWMFSEKELLFFNLKKKNLLISLEQLKILFNKKYNFNITKGALNHWLIKLKKIYESNLNN